MQIDSLYEYAKKYNVTLTDTHLEKFSSFLGFLTEWNSKMNLIGTSDRDRIIIELLLDSLIPVSYLPSTGNMADIGSGAGFPGLIIKILKPDIKIKLIESNGKKISFLKHIIRSLQLKNITTVNKPIETIVDSLKNEEFDLITSRAMTDLNSLIRLCSSMLMPDGMLIGFLGSQWENELKKNEDSIKENQLFIDNFITYNLPGKSTERSIVLLKKESSI